jgi:valyl-tRNA synthetase
VESAESLALSDSTLSDSTLSDSTLSTQHSALPRQWITARADETIANARKLMDDYQYGEAGKLIYEFAWNDFCDWYVEMAKLNFNHETAAVLVRILDTILRLLHPFMPYVTEALWQKLQEVAQGKFDLESLRYPALILAPYPVAGQSSISSANLQSPISQMSAVQDVIRAIRNVRADYKVPPEKRVAAHISAGKMSVVLQGQRAAIGALARVDESTLTIAPHVPAPESCVTQALGDITVYLPMAGLVDLDAERQRLQGELEALLAQIEKGQKLLSSDFGKRAPANVIEKEKARIAEAQQKRDQIAQRLTAL